MVHITATDFQNNTAKLMKMISDNGEEIIITKHGHPILKLTSLVSQTKNKWERAFGCMKGTARQLGDIIEPVEDFECNGDWENFEPFMKKKND